MKLNISINEVLRDFIGQLVYTYDKYIGLEKLRKADPLNTEIQQIKETDITSFDLNRFLKFESTQELNKFLYLESALEVFGHADVMSKGLMNHFNYLIEDMVDEGNEITLVSREANKSIPSTYFFLSKTGCRIDRIHFVKDSKNEWQDCDILITANPDALLYKPEGKISVKIEAPYNTNVTGDYELKSILEFIKDEGLRNKILNTKITTYEEI